uniref:MPK7 n=1 Tax=Arundo donax TaxID=35708 RepID=A0A0A9FRR7_ARUDO
MQVPLGRLDPSFVLLTMHAAQSQSQRALSRLAHH